MKKWTQVVSNLVGRPNQPPTTWDTIHINREALLFWSKHNLQRMISSLNTWSKWTTSLSNRSRITTDRWYWVNTTILWNQLVVPSLSLPLGTPEITRIILESLRKPIPKVWFTPAKTGKVSNPSRCRAHSISKWSHRFINLVPQVDISVTHNRELDLVPTSDRFHHFRGKTWARRRTHLIQLV